MLFLCGFIVIFSSCKKGGCNVIPDVSFLERVSLVEHQELRIPNQAVTIDRGGVAGLVVVYLGNNQYIAYDRCSTVAPEKKCAVTVEGMVATDPCSRAKYILINGSPAEIAECPLKPYRAVKSGETILISH
jgi:hypothetical protein